MHLHYHVGVTALSINSCFMHYYTFNAHMCIIKKHVFIYDWNTQSATEVVYVAEVLLRCSSESVKQAPDLQPRPASSDVKGEMVVSIMLAYV